MSNTFGAPLGASIPFGKSGVESLTVRPILPLNGCSGCGRTLASALTGGAAIALCQGDLSVAASQPSMLDNPRTTISVREFVFMNGPPLRRARKRYVGPN